MINHILKSVFVYLMFFTTIAYAQKNTQAYPVDSSYTVNNQLRKYKKHYTYLIPAKDMDLKGVKSERDVLYTTLKKTKYGKRDLHLDIFHPEKEGKYPAIILVHGGGWRAGNKRLLVPMAQMIAKRGYVAVSVEYQLGLEAPYPAAVHNIKSAIRWMRANAETFDIDTEKIAISGTSAGGHLASLVGLTNDIEKFEGVMGNKEFSSDVQAIIDIDGVLNFMAPVSLNKERGDDSPDVQWIGGQFKDVPELWKEVSPIYWANKNSVPMLFINSGYPRFHAGQAELIGMLKEWGIHYDVVKFKVRMHTFWLFHPFIDETVDYMVDFMNKVL